MGDYVTTVKLDNPWALYMCEEVIPGSGFYTLTDSSGNGRDMNAAAIANFSNTTSLLTGRSRSIHRASGADIPVGAGNPVGSGNHDYSIECWMRFPATINGFRYIAGFGHAAAHNTPGLGLNGNGTTNDGVAATNSADIFGGTSIVPNTIYYFLMVWQSGTNTMTFYLGRGGTFASDASGNLTAPSIGAGDTHQLWDAPASVGGIDYVGDLQAVGFYSSALTPTQGQTHYNAGLGIFSGGSFRPLQAGVPLVGRHAQSTGQVG